MLPTGPDITPKKIFNPDTEDFSVMFALEKIPEKYTIRSRETLTFPTYLADHITKHLVQYIVLKRGVKTNYEDEYEKVKKEVLKYDNK